MYCNTSQSQHGHQLTSNISLLDSLSTNDGIEQIKYDITD